MDMSKTEQSGEDITLEANEKSEVPTLDVDDVTQLEHHIQASGISMDHLMDNAGHAVAQYIMNTTPAPAHICVCAGGGNNGGDGWVCARELVKHGYIVDVEALCAPSAIKAQPAHETALRVVNAMRGNDAFHVDVAPSADALSAKLGDADICVDALLGTGFTGLEVRAPQDAWISSINAAHTHGCTVVSVDVPSGLNAHNGMPATPCVSADATIVMMVKKTGLEMKFGLQKCGTIFIAHITDLSPYKEFLNRVRIDY